MATKVSRPAFANLDSKYLHNSPLASQCREAAHLAVVVQPLQRGMRRLPVLESYEGKALGPREPTAIVAGRRLQ